MKNLNENLDIKKPQNKKIISKFKVKDQKYSFKKSLKSKVSNSQFFCNIKEVKDDGILILKTNEVAILYEVQAIDLTLSSRNEKDSFFNSLKYLYQIKELNLKCYKLDKRINLNMNKDYTRKLINKYINDSQNVTLVKERLELIEKLEKDNLTLSSSYYFIIIASDIDILKKQMLEVEQITSSLNPRLNIDMIKNKLEIYKFLMSLYYTDLSLNSLMWIDYPSMVSPTYLSEKTNYLQLDNKEIQMLTIKNIAPFVDDMFFQEIFNYPNLKACLNIQDSVDNDNLINILDSRYQFLISDRNTTKKLSDATELDTQKENFQILMNELKNGNEKIKEVSLILALEGTQKDREETFRQLSRIADKYKIKLDIPRLRQIETWQSFDITGRSLKDYSFFLPTLTLAAGFSLTKTYHNDYKGYILGTDLFTGLPIHWDQFFLDGKERVSHNLSIIGSTGAGKSFAIRKILINEIRSKILILDPEGEFESLIQENNGEYIDLYSKQNGIINPLQIRFIPNDDDNRNSKYKDCPLAKHLGFLETFFKTAFEHLNEKELVVLLNIVEALYNKKGFYNNTTIEQLQRRKNTDYPIFSDLKRFIPEYKKRIQSPEKIEVINQLEILLSRFLTSTDKYLFDDYTSIDLSNNLIAFNMKELLYSGNKRLINTQTLNILTYLNNAVISNKLSNDKLSPSDKKPLILVADEFHLFIDEDNPEILRQFSQFARRLRKYTGALIVSTQSIFDFVGNSNILRHAQAIFNNCQYSLVGMLKETDLSAYLEIFKDNPLTDTQKATLLKASQGEFLFNVTRRKRLRVKITATPYERKLMGD